MKISRRTFLQVLVAVPAIAKAYPKAYAGTSEVITIPSVLSEISPRHFGTSRRTIEGPCKIYEFISSIGGMPMDAFCQFAILRDNAATLMEWGQNQRALFRWVGVPGTELVVPEGRTVQLVPMGVQYTDAHTTLAERNLDWMPWTMFERPDEDGHYGPAPSMPLWKGDNFEYDEDDLQDIDADEDA